MVLDIPGINLPRDLKHMAATLTSPMGKMQAVSLKVSPDNNAAVTFTPEDIGEYKVITTSCCCIVLSAYLKLVYVVRTHFLHAYVVHAYVVTLISYPLISLTPYLVPVYLINCLS